MEWRIIGLSAIVNATLTILLSIMVFPLFFLGPLIGGFLAAFLSKGYEDYEIMDEKDGAVIGAVSGLIGGLLVVVLMLVGMGPHNLTGYIPLSNIFLRVYILLQIMVSLSLVLSLIGGFIGASVKEK